MERVVVCIPNLSLSPLAWQIPNPRIHEVGSCPPPSSSSSSSSSFSGQPRLSSRLHELLRKVGAPSEYVELCVKYEDCLRKVSLSQGSKGAV